MVLIRLIYMRQCSIFLQKSGASSQRMLFYLTCGVISSPQKRQQWGRKGYIYIYMDEFGSLMIEMPCFKLGKLGISSFRNSTSMRCLILEGYEFPNCGLWISVHDPSGSQQVLPEAFLFRCVRNWFVFWILFFSFCCCFDYELVVAFRFIVWLPIFESLVRSRLRLLT